MNYEYYDYKMASDWLYFAEHVIIIVIHLLNPKYIWFFLVGINIITKTFLSKMKIDVILKYSNTLCWLYVSYILLSVFLFS